MFDILLSHLRAALLRYTPLIGLCILPFLFMALLTFAGCSPGTAPHRVVAARPSPQFVSETECAPCHGDISKACAVSNHARTLRAATRSALGALAPPAQGIPGTFYEVHADGNNLRFASTLVPDAEKSMDLVLGSGKLGMTYVTLEKGNSLTELRMSWYPTRKTWYLTPGQENDANNGPGEHNDSDRAQKCIGCHAITVPANRLRPEDRFFGVGCQSCHGPASEHIAAVKAGQVADVKMERMETWSATRINNMCGRCHRSAVNVSTSGPEVTMTQRFQPYGLMQSPCFQKSGDTLSCITCHNPHGNASKDPRVYEAACLRCHSASPSTAPRAGHPALDASLRKVCPVSPRSKCVECHMPKRKVFPSSEIPISMADHLIWAYGKQEHKR